MKNTETEAAPCGPSTQLCAGRRQFLTRSVAGGLAIALGSAALVSNARADGPTVEADVPVPDAAVPDAAVPDAAVPDAAVPDAAVPDAAAPTAKDYELVVKPSEYPELATVGGYVTLETRVGKIVVARVSETEFSAVGAVCTHKGGPIKYNADDQEFFCPLHKSKFDLQGAVLKGPAKVALPSYIEETVAVIKLS